MDKYKLNANSNCMLKCVYSKVYVNKIDYYFFKIEY